MAKSRAFIPIALRPWIEARRRFHLSHAHIQMARALGMNPKKLAKLANHLQQPWKAPLPEFITRLYVKRFGRLMPEALQRAKKRAKKQARKDRKAAAAGSPQTDADRRDERSAGVVPEAALKLKPHVPTH
jgi:hypothetical protein